jgi:hypothetical protein
MVRQTCGIDPTGTGKIDGLNLWGRLDSEGERKARSTIPNASVRITVRLLELQPLV